MSGQPAITINPYCKNIDFVSYQVVDHVRA